MLAFDTTVAQFPGALDIWRPLQKFERPWLVLQRGFRCKFRLRLHRLDNRFEIPRLARVVREIPAIVHDRMAHSTSETDRKESVWHHTIKIGGVIVGCTAVHGFVIRVSVGSLNRIGMDLIRVDFWATTLAKLLTDENSCEWAGWFKAHHQGWSKSPSDFDRATRMIEHTALLNRERDSLERIGYDVYTENQNLFRLRGSTATIAGKPDLIGDKHHEILLSDAKTGHPSPSHTVQVRIYQYAIPKAPQQFHGKDSRGQVRYPDSYVGSSASAVNPEFVGNIGTLIRRLAADTPARRVPSASECRFCDISKEDWPAKDRRQLRLRGHDRRLLKNAAERARNARFEASKTRDK